MKIHIRFDDYNAEHSRLTVFINGKNNGQLCMSPAEADWFYLALAKGAMSIGMEFVGSGHNAKDGDRIRPFPESPEGPDGGAKVDNDAGQPQGAA